MMVAQVKERTDDASQTRLQHEAHHEGTMRMPRGSLVILTCLVQKSQAYGFSLIIIGTYM